MWMGNTSPIAITGSSFQKNSPGNVNTPGFEAAYQKCGRKERVGIKDYGKRREKTMHDEKSGEGCRYDEEREDCMYDEEREDCMYDEKRDGFM